METQKQPIGAYTDFVGPRVTCPRRKAKQIPAKYFSRTNKKLGECSTIHFRKINPGYTKLNATSTISVHISLPRTF